MSLTGEAKGALTRGFHRCGWKNTGGSYEFLKKIIPLEM
jgi:hypothetical protein